MTEPLLPIENDPAFQRRSWLVERIGWALMTVFVLLGLLGLLGSGPLSHREHRTPDGTLRVQYERFARRHAEQVLRIEIASADRIGLWLDREWLDRTRVEEIVPQPESMIAAADGVICTFHGSPDHSTVVKITVSALAMGPTRILLGVPDRDHAELAQFIYP